MYSSYASSTRDHTFAAEICSLDGKNSGPLPNKYVTQQQMREDLSEGNDHRNNVFPKSIENILRVIQCCQGVGDDTADLRSSVCSLFAWLYRRIYCLPTRGTGVDIEHAQ